MKESCSWLMTRLWCQLITWLKCVDMRSFRYIGRKYKISKKEVIFQMGVNLGIDSCVDLFSLIFSYSLDYIVTTGTDVAELWSKWALSHIMLRYFLGDLAISLFMFHTYSSELYYWLACWFQYRFNYSFVWYWLCIYDSIRCWWECGPHIFLWQVSRNCSALSPAFQKLHRWPGHSTEDRISTHM